MLELNNAVALIIGGASGMGLATAKALAVKGCHIIIADINRERMEQAKQAIVVTGVDCTTIDCDIGDDASVEAMRDSSINWKNDVHIVMNTAGCSLLGPPHTVPLDEWQHLLNINVMGTVRVCNALLPHMLARGSGHLVNTGSLAGKMAYTHTAAPYIASKHAVNGYTEALAIYAKAHGVGVTCLSPGYVESNFGEHARFSGTDEPEKWFDMPDFMLQAGVAAEDVGLMVVDAILNNHYDLYTHPALAKVVTDRYADLDAAIDRQVDNVAN